MGSSDSVSSSLRWLLPPVKCQCHALSTEAHKIFVRYVLTRLHVAVVADATLLDQRGTAGDVQVTSLQFSCPRRPIVGPNPRSTHPMLFIKLRDASRQE